MSELLPFGPNFDANDDLLHIETLYEDETKTLALVILNGINRKTVNHRSTTTYNVIAGSGTMHVDDRIHILGEGSTVTIQVGTPYYDEGQLVMLATSIPPFDIDSVEEVE